MTSKRGTVEGGVRRRKDGRWEARYTIHTASGPNHNTIYGRTRREVTAELAEALADREKGLVFEAGNVTVGEYLDRWLNDSVKGPT
jgi:integrase